MEKTHGNPNHDFPEGEALDLEELLQRVDGDRVLLGEIAQMFLEDCPGLLDDVRASIRDGNASRLRMAAHTLRGSVANFGAAPSQRAAQALEAMGRAGDLAGAEDAFHALDQAIQRLQPKLQLLIATSV